MFTAVGDQGFEQVEPHFTGGESVGVVASKLLAKLHQQIEVGFLLEAGGADSLVGVDGVHQDEHDAGKSVVFPLVEQELHLGEHQFGAALELFDVVVFLEHLGEGEDGFQVVAHDFHVFFVAELLEDVG